MKECILASWGHSGSPRKVRILVSYFGKHKTSNQQFVKRNHFYFPSCNHQRSTQRKERLIELQNKISKTLSLLASAVKHRVFWYGNSFLVSQGHKRLLLFWQLVPCYFKTLHSRVVLSKVCVFQSGSFSRLDRFNGLDSVLN